MAEQPALRSKRECYDVAILGAGAAGLFCAGQLRGSGLRVVVIDHAPEPGRKILISGGGRANFTNLHTGPEHFLSGNPHFCKSALSSYTPDEFVALVERYGIAYHPKAPGQLFCDGSARQIVEMLVAECADAEIRLGAQVAQVEQVERVEPFDSLDRASEFTLHLSQGSARETITSRKVVVATGGLSIPKLGATGFGYELARQFGIRVVPTRAALVPFTFHPEDAQRFAGLSGVATEAVVTVLDAANARGDRLHLREKVQFQDKLLITHRGLSGPVVLQASSYWKPGTALVIDLAPGQQVTAPLLAPKARRDEATALAAWGAVLPRRLADRLLQVAPPAAWTNEALYAAEQTLHAWPLMPAGTEGYAKAEVTAGGVSTDELNARTMEARMVKGLYFIGEVVDVTGHLGGYNFQWAWASAAAAARALAAT